MGELPPPCKPSPSPKNELTAPDILFLLSFDDVEEILAVQSETLASSWLAEDDGLSEDDIANPVAKRQLWLCAEHPFRSDRGYSCLGGIYYHGADQSNPYDRVNIKSASIPP